MAEKSFPDLPPIWMAGAMVAIVMIDRMVPEQGLRLPGFVLMLIGIGLILWAGSYFQRKNTPIHPGVAPKSLLIEGPFKINRNPIYTGMAVILAGFAIATGAYFGLILVPVFMWIITERFIKGEEALMRQAFPDEAAAYIAATRRW
ncbi:protein-S-isoprenylcysteine O-methyltransferase Ste14 [Rubricella aquisinus]|uniref:Protein-S-isoprenylcysteine O-methyltransferase Ste14 n=1 Tax=Rubricella aquisinus TaxID=2028108 RepID=A0A840WQA5_9RHOB|nr:isoprenylcysteine carboxylmethyltransferase family protein [Rubricella aquisinus]MBB5516233.1 protein-S-isoprenylcysteine O-methyltransferase Ste14 [Rubricella aquisinus]